MRIGGEEVLDLLLPLLQDLHTQRQNASAVTPVKWLERLLQPLQGFLGCQGLGFYLPEETRWRCVVGLGGRSLGSPAAEWLQQVFEQQKMIVQPDAPAAGWGQLAFPFRCEMLDARPGVLVVSARHPQVLPTAFCRRLLPLLETVCLIGRDLRIAEQSVSEDERFSARAAALVPSASFPAFLQQWEQMLQHFLPDLRLALQWQLAGSDSPRYFLKAGAEQIAVVQPNSDLASSFSQKAAVIAEDAVAQAAETGFAELRSLPRLLWPEETSVMQVRSFQWPAVLPHLRGELLLFWPEKVAFPQTISRSLSLLTLHIASRLQHEQLRLQLAEFTGPRQHNPLPWQGLLPGEVQTQLRELQAVRLPILLTGETGTGKTVAARFLHAQRELAGSSPEDAASFHVLDCRHLSAQSLRSLLFPERQELLPLTSLFLTASAGSRTLLLQQIGELSPESQIVLLEYCRLQEQPPNKETGSVWRVVVTGPDQAPFGEQEPQFLEELRQRLSVIRLRLPPLRERTAGILIQLDALLQSLCTQSGREVPVLAPTARDFLQQFDWPGNLPQLLELSRQLATFPPGQEVTIHDLQRILSPVEFTGQAAEENPPGLTEATLQFQRQYIRHAIARCQGNMSEAARLLDLHRSNLYRKMHQLNMAEAGDETARETDNSSELSEPLSDSKMPPSE